MSRYFNEDTKVYNLHEETYEYRGFKVRLREVITNGVWVSRDDRISSRFYHYKLGGQSYKTLASVTRIISGAFIENALRDNQFASVAMKVAAVVGTAVHGYVARRVMGQSPQEAAEHVGQSSLAKTGEYAYERMLSICGNLPMQNGAPMVGIFDILDSNGIFLKEVAVGGTPDLTAEFAGPNQQACIGCVELKTAQGALSEDEKKIATKQQLANHNSSANSYWQQVAAYGAMLGLANKKPVAMSVTDISADLNHLSTLTPLDYYHRFLQKLIKRAV